MDFTVSRRLALVGAATLATSAIAATVTVSPLAAQPSAKTFVLVHGAWHGGWCWKRVADRLRQRGHTVFTPTMTGLGERSHLISKEVTLSTHIADIANTIEWENLTDIVLVAHSYGGLIASGVAERLHSRIGSIVFLDAFLPEDGETLLQKSSPVFVDAINRAMAVGDSGIKAPPSAAFGIAPEDRSWVDSKTTPQPVGTYTEKAVYTGGREKIAQRSYIRALQYKSATFDNNVAKLRAQGTWQIHEMNCGHDVMVIAPEQLTTLLLA
jgi:pimeloyl-ACP methyl ester carboxylesterase